MNNMQNAILFYHFGPSVRPSRCVIGSKCRHASSSFLGASFYRAPQ